MGGFIQQLAVQYVTHGYWRYVTGHIPEHKDPRAVDEKLIRRYDISISSAERSRRKKAGRANVQYIRHKRLFVLVATKGRHRFYEEEAGQIRDFRRDVLKVRGYAIAYRRGHVSVRIERGEFRRLKTYFENIAVHKSARAVGDEFHRVRYEPYAPIRSQLVALLRTTNRQRKIAGMPAVPFHALRLRRRIHAPFRECQVLGACVGRPLRSCRGERENVAPRVPNRASTLPLTTDLDFPPGRDKL